MLGTVVYDDTVTVYLNGRRIAGHGDGKIEKNLQYEVPDGTSGEGDPVTARFSVPASALRAGANTLAIEVHQCNSTSSDVYLGPGPLAQTAESLPFTDAQLGTSYASDTRPTAPGGGDYFTWLLRSFDAVRNTPSIMGANEVLPKGTTYEELAALNDRTVIDINNTPPGPPIPRCTRHLWTVRTVRTEPWRTDWAPPSADSTTRR